MKTSRLLAALLLTAFTAVARAAVTQTVSELDGGKAAFIVGNFFDSWYEVHSRAGIGAGNVSKALETHASAGTPPDHESVYTSRNDTMTAAKSAVANAAAARSRSGFGGPGEGGGGGPSGKSPPGPAAKPDSKTSGDTTPAEGLKLLKPGTFLTGFPDTPAVQLDTAQELSPTGALENPVDWRWASLNDSDKSIWKSADRTLRASFTADDKKPEILTRDHPDLRRNLNLKNQSSINRFPIVVAAPEPAGVLTMAGFLGLALFSRRRSALRL